MTDRDRDMMDIIISRMRQWLEAWEEREPPTPDLVAFHYRRITEEVKRELGHEGQPNGNGNGNGHGGGVSSGAA
jgi:hypothetical protein